MIVNGRAKVTGMVNDISKTSLDDYSDHLHLAIIIRRSFGTKQLAIPTELELFITYISTEKPSRYASKLYTHTHTLTLKYLTYTILVQVAQYRKSSNFSIPFTKIELQGDCSYDLVFWEVQKVLCVGTK